ncbi:MAG: hypothetical protein CM1200mP34_0760 [Verrucomicrobiales bacterium]|nr:MAG: hypothetical protein CM1200mP34_0760 [Verrucomicrobiales bacterium]
MRNWQASNASARCGATTSTQRDGSFTGTTPTRWTKRTDSTGHRWPSASNNNPNW